MDTGMVVFAALLLAFALIARRLARWYVTAPITFLAAGALIDVAVDVPVSSEAVTLLAESTLALLLFHDSAQVRPREIDQERSLVSRLLLLGLPLTILLGFGLSALLFPDLGWPFWLLLAAALAPTDAGLGAPTVLNPRVPVRVRRVLNVESGLNDGLATPVVLFAIAVAAGTEGMRASESLRDALVEILLGVVVGAAVGAGGGLLATSSRSRGWSSRPSRAFAALALPLGAYAAATLVSGNGFIAAFVAGTAYASAAPWLAEEESSLVLSESVADLLGFMVWFVVGLTASRFLLDLGWREVAFSVLALTLLRMGPVWMTLLGSGLNRRTVAFIGWFGPRGLASVVFALLALEELRDDPKLETVLTVIVLTVVLSVVLHGVTAEPWARRYGGWVEQTRPVAETATAAEPRIRSRLYLNPLHAREK